MAFNRARTQENRSSEFPTRSDKTRPVQLQKKARSLTARDVAKTKALISCAVTAQLICDFFFRIGKKNTKQQVFS